jgi:ubiquinone/menaquinone biosynthesis C-methylase UbiE
MQPTAQVWIADSWGSLHDAPVAAVADVVSVLEEFYVAAEGFRDARRRLLEAAHIRDGQHLLEVACGTMPQLAETAAQVGREGRIVGLDSAAALLRVAQERARTLGIDQVIFRQGDCRRLPFAEATFDAVLADKLLLHVGPGAVIVSEMLRVTRPGGWIGALDWDGEAVLIAAEDQAVTRRILDVNRDQRACFDAARRAAGWFTLAGATEVTVAGVLACFTDNAHPLMRALVQRWADRAVRAATVQPEAGVAWLSDVLAPQRPGSLLAFPIIVTAGKKPA